LNNSIAAGIAKHAWMSLVLQEKKYQDSFKHGNTVD